jgi:hypothetical protein
MQQRLSYILGLIALATIGFVGSAGAQTVAPGPYYANPSWDQTLACTALATCPPFIVLSNMSSAAVLDRETGLVWEKSPSNGGSSWHDAQNHCNSLTTGGRLGWRLPTIQELASLVDPTQSNPPLPSGHPFSNVQVIMYYWTATTVYIPGDTSMAWVVAFASTGSLSQWAKGWPYGGIFYWCVRGGQGVDPQ